MKKTCLIFSGLALGGVTGCFEPGMDFSNLQQECASNSTDFEKCSVDLTPDYEEVVVIVDSFERDVIAPEGSDLTSLWWRTVINDQGKIFDGTPAPSVDAAIFSDSEMSLAAHGNRALYFYGREGSSVHNIYLISQEVDLSDFKTVELDFSYLLIDLEPKDYMKVEVCNDVADQCGVGENLDLSKFNSPAWVSVYEVSGGGKGLNGKNHVEADWLKAELDLDLDSMETKKFVLRFNVRVDEGFIKNKYAGNMEDGVALDAVTLRATTKASGQPIF